MLIELERKILQKPGDYFVIYLNLYFGEENLVNSNICQYRVEKKKNHIPAKYH
jgi:hypothetical protein